MQAMFEAAVSGSRTDEIEGVNVVIRPALTAAAADVLAADGYLLGTPAALALVTFTRIPVCSSPARLLQRPIRVAGGYVTTSDAPTMAGFEWSPTPGFVPMGPGEDGWCMRDAICQLFGWRPGSEEWLRFIEAPVGKDTPLLAEYLGLACFQVPQDWSELISRLAHPGAAIFDLHADQKSHVVYVHDLRWLLHHWPTIDGRPARPEDRPLWCYGWPLGREHMIRGPVFGAVLVDERQPPRAA